MIPQGRILAVDWGLVRIGLAISDPEQKFSFPLETYTRRTWEIDAAYFRKIFERERPQCLIIGLPLHLKGTEGTDARLAREYGTWLQKISGLPVFYADERYSSRFAEEILWEAGLTHKKRKAKRDQLAAQIFLQAFLEAGCPVQVEAKLDG
ncbi:MAG: Holliday junction resolvase RuvX [Gemmataceae bacterium]|jgi:putative Holliday junction resolvase|nr:Holliday junction resolvase RuvX [Gemmataceae bacterium]